MPYLSSLITLLVASLINKFYLITSILFLLKMCLKLKAQSSKVYTLCMAKANLV